MGPVSKAAVEIGFSAILAELRQQRSTIQVNQQSVMSTLQAIQDHLTQDTEARAAQISELNRRILELESERQDTANAT